MILGLMLQNHIKNFFRMQKMKTDFEVVWRKGDAEMPDKGVKRV